MRQTPLIAPRSSLPYIVIIPEMGPRSWTNQRRKSSLWQNWRPQLLSVTLTSLKRYLQLETLDIILVNLIFGWNCVWQKIVSPAVSWPLSFIEGPSSRSLLKTALILSSVLIECFLKCFLSLSFASPPLLFKLLFKKLPARPTREILAVFAHFTKEKYLEMIKPEKMLNMD